MSEHIIQDCVDIISEHVSDPANSGIERFVGLEHYIPGDVVIKKYGNTANLASAMKKFQKGDILVARRNVYLHRASMARFEGLTSGDTIVLRPRNESYARIIPFLLNTEAFWAYAEKHSDGTMSKRLSPSLLSQYSFSLPDKELEYYSDLLWQTEKVIEAQEYELECAIEMRNSFYEKTQKEEYFTSHGLNYHIGEIGEEYEICNNLRKPISQAVRSEMKGSYPYWGPTSILDYISEYRLDGEYALIGEDGDHFLKYLDWDMTHLVKGRFNVNNHAHVIKTNGNNLIKWFYYYFKHRDIEDKLTKQGGGRLKLTKTTLVTLPMLIPDIEIQADLCEKYDMMESMIDALKNKIVMSKKLQKDLSESFLSKEV